MSINYNEQTINFLKATKSTLTIDYLATEPNPNWKDDKAYCNHYKCVLRHNRKQYTFDFWDSIHNTEYGIEPNEYDILACLEKYQPEDTFEGFCYEFGYDTDSISALRIYKAVCKQYKALCRLYNEEEMALLAEIC